MKKPLVVLVVFSVLVTPLYAAAPSPHTPTSSILEAAEIAAASGMYRVQNTTTVATGRIRKDDKKRSAIAYALSGAMAFAGAALWRWLPCRNIPTEPTLSATENTKYFKCFNADGQRKGLETPTKALLAAGVTLEAVSLIYFIAHLTSDREEP